MGPTPGRPPRGPRRLRRFAGPAPPPLQSASGTVSAMATKSTASSVFQGEDEEDEEEMAPDSWGRLGGQLWGNSARGRPRDSENGLQVPGGRMAQHAVVVDGTVRGRGQ